MVLIKKHQNQKWDGQPTGGNGCLVSAKKSYGVIKDTKKSKEEIRMKKIVNIGGKDYSMKSSAWTQFKYKNDTGRKLLQDIQSITKLADIQEAEVLGEMDDMIEILLRMAYTMIEEADPTQVQNYETFLKETDGIFEDQQWIMDVIELATSPISRGIQTNIKEK